MMEEGAQWKRIYSTKFYMEAEIIRGTLQENLIPVQLLNKQDSMYNIALGEIEIYVPMHFQELAQSLLNKTLEN